MIIDNIIYGIQEYFYIDLHNLVSINNLTKRL